MKQIDQEEFKTNIPQLKELNLSLNQLGSIDLSGLGNLKILNLENNLIEFFDLGNLSELECLKLENNKIEMLNSFCGMDSLSQLNLDGNFIKTLTQIHLQD